MLAKFVRAGFMAIRAPCNEAGRAAVSTSPRDCSLDDTANPCVHVPRSLQYVDCAASSLIRSELP